VCSRNSGAGNFRGQPTYRVRIPSRRSDFSRQLRDAGIQFRRRLQIQFSDVIRIFRACCSPLSGRPRLRQKRENPFVSNLRIISGRVVNGAGQIHPQRAAPRRSIVGARVIREIPRNLITCAGANRESLASGWSKTNKLEFGDDRQPSHQAANPAESSRLVPRRATPAVFSCEYQRLPSKVERAIPRQRNIG